MTNLEVQVQGDTLVVDSRLIADHLGITPKSFHETIQEHETQMDQVFGCTRRETADIKMPNGGTREELSHYLLTEDQSTFLMTLSRNTPKVVQAKLSLVRSFSAAKSALMSENIGKTEVFNTASTSVLDPAFVELLKLSVTTGMDPEKVFDLHHKHGRIPVFGAKGKIQSSNPLKVVSTRWQREPLSVDAMVEIIRMVANRHGDDGWITARAIYRQTRRAGSSNDVKRLLRDLESKGVVTCQASEKSTKYRFNIK